jgi:hypothetical protein
MNHDKKLFHVCETCGFKFGKKDYYDNHVKFIHPLPQEDDDEEEEEEEEEDCDDYPIDPLENRRDAQIRLSAVSKSKRSSSFDLSNTQLLTILEQNQGRRITIVGPDGEVKYLSVTPKQQTNPQVWNQLIGVNLTLTADFHKRRLTCRFRMRQRRILPNSKM